MHLTGAARDIVIGALQERQRAGVRVRICYDSGDNPSKVESLNAQPQTTMTGTFLAGTGLPSKPITSERHLMHQKYVILDAYTPQAQVWTGLEQLHRRSWTLQENNMLICPRPRWPITSSRTFRSSRATGDIQTTGAKDTGRVTLSYGGAPAPTTVSFAPGQGEWIDAQVARCIGRAQREVTLGTRRAHVRRISSARWRSDAGPRADRRHLRPTQMQGVFDQWQADPHAGWKIPAFQALVHYAHLTGKDHALDPDQRARFHAQ